jgi:hypothetical protein
LTLGPMTSVSAETTAGWARASRMSGESLCGKWVHADRRTTSSSGVSLPAGHGERAPRTVYPPRRRGAVSARTIHQSQHRPRDARRLIS